MINRKVAPPIQDATSFTFELAPVDHYIWSNGTPLYALKAGTQDVVQIDWIFDAGLWFEQRTAVAQTVAALLKNGTSTKSALQINEAIEYYGASLKVAANNDYAIVTLHCLTKQLPFLLPIVKEILSDATFPDSELELFKQNAYQRLAISLKQCDFVANRNIDAFLFGKQHPYGRFTEPSDLESLNAQSLRDFYRKHYLQGKCRVFVAGTFGKEHLDMLEQFFGKEQREVSETALRASAIIDSVASKGKHFIQNDPNGVQAAIRIARRFPTRKDPDFTPMLVLNTILGGYFGSRLMSNIREEKGYTYGIYSHIYNYKHDGALLIATEAGRDVADLTIKEAYYEMNRLQQERIGDEELGLVKNYLLGNILGDLDGPFSLIQRWKNIILNDLPFDYFDSQIETYKSIAAPQLQELAQKYLSVTDYYELSVV